MNPSENENKTDLTCKNCGSQQINNFCSNCGQKKYTKRFTIKSFFQQIIDAFDIEKGFFYALKMLIINPGKVINEYLAGKTKAYFNPLKFFIIIAGTSAVLLIWFNLYDANIKTTNELMGVEQSKETLQLQQNMSAFMKQYTNIIALFRLL